MNADTFKNSASIVPFLCHVLGPDYEVALYDLTGPQPSVVVIGNGHITGRSAGAGLTTTAMNLIKSRLWEKQDWELNYQETSANGRLLRSSALFIKEPDGTLRGMMCISFDDSRFRELSEKVLSLCHPDEFTAQKISISSNMEADDKVLAASENVTSAAIQATERPETYGDSVNAMVESAMIAVMNTADIPAERLKQEERMKIIRLLNQKDVFSRKGAISIVAEKLSCSKSSIYRYLSNIN